jgi:hypothetical protein
MEGISGRRGGDRRRGTRAGDGGEAPGRKGSMPTMAHPRRLSKKTGRSECAVARPQNLSHGFAAVTTRTSLATGHTATALPTTEPSADCRSRSARPTGTAWATPDLTSKVNTDCRSRSARPTGTAWATPDLTSKVNTDCRSRSARPTGAAWAAPTQLLSRASRETGRRGRPSRGDRRRPRGDTARSPRRPCGGAAPRSCRR